MSAVQLQTSQGPRVFISYTHDSAIHKDAVLKVADRLRADGVDAWIDQYEASFTVGLARWMVNQVQDAQYVLVICTRSYQTRFEGREEPGIGRGANWEGAVITQELYEAEGRNNKFIPVVFSDDDIAYIPIILKGAKRFNVCEESDYLDLYRLLTNQPETPPADLGELIVLPPRPRPVASGEAGTEEKTYLPSLALTEQLNLQAGVEKVEQLMRQLAELNLQAGVEKVEQLIRQLAELEGTTNLNLVARIGPAPDHPPLDPVAYASRQGTLDRINTALESSFWVALVGSTGMGKTLLAKSIWESKAEDERYWISFSGQEGRHEYHLELQLLGCLIKVTDDESLLERFHSGRIGGIEITQQLSVLVPQDALLVLDDLPYLGGNDTLIDRLASLAVTWWNVGGKVLSTSQFELPTRLLGILGTPLDRFPVPDMDNQDVQELLVSAGAPQDFLKPNTVRALVAITKGHPVLVGAAAQWLLRNNWRLDDQAFTSLLSGTALSEPMTEARTKVRGLVNSDSARGLLDRLSMVNGYFNQDMVWAIGNVTPPIERPIEQFLDLVGPWIQRSGDTEYAVSPLLQNTWQAHVPVDLQKKIHGAIAQQYIKTGTLSIDNAFQVSVHLAGSEDWLGLAAALFQVMNATKDPQQIERASWVLWFFKPGIRWPDEVPYQLRIVIRAMQVRGLLVTQKPTEDYESDLEKLIENAEPADSIAVFFAYHQTSFLLDHVSPEVTAHKAIQGARAFHMADPDFRRDISIQPEQGFWGAIPRVKDLTQILGIIEVVREMTLEERKIVFSPHLGTDMARLLADMCYPIEADQPADAQDWDKVLSLIGEIQIAGELEGAEVLSWAALRARAMVVADFQGNTQGALSLLEVDYTGVDESYRFLLTYTQACILLSHNESQPAFEKFHDALSISVEADFPLLLSDALGRGMIAAGKAGRFDVSIIWGRRALQRGTDEVGVGPYEKIELLGELAWAYWSNGDQKKACGAMFGAVTKLISSRQPDTVRHKETMGKLGHVLGWLSSVSLRGAPPKKISDGQPYIDPYPGVIYQRNEQIAELDTSSRLHYLTYQLAMMASGVGLSGLAVAAYKVGAELGRAQGYLVFSASTVLERAPIEAKLGNFDQALEAMLSGLRAIPIMQNNQTTALDSFDDPDEHWTSLDVSEKMSIESFHIYYEVLLPAFTSLVAKGADRDAALRAVGNLNSAFERLGNRLLLADRWQRIVKHMEKAFNPAYTRNDIVNELGYLSDGDNHERFTLYIALASHPERTPSDMSRLHAIVLTHLTTPLPSNHSVVDNVVRWITGSWQHEVNTRAFRLKSPGLLRKALETLAVDSPKVSDAAQVVLASEVVSETQFSGELRALLQQLATT